MDNTKAVAQGRALNRLWTYEKYGELLRNLPTPKDSSYVPLFKMVASKGNDIWLIDDCMSLSQVRALRRILEHKKYKVTVELLPDKNRLTPEPG